MVLHDRMKGIVLAGEGKRLGHLSYHLQKCMFDGR
jgi:hypothetical protein